MKSLVSCLPIITVACLSLSGCASIVSGTHQTISLETPPTRDALCTLENNKGTWFLNSTPGTVTVQRSFEDLNIHCEKKGYRKANLKVKSTTKAIAFGNVLFGGAVGACVDVADGAAFRYPTNIRVPMRK
jgi:uncharacterized protein YceK